MSCQCDMMRLSIDLPLSHFDLTAFNDIPTGYTPTTPKSGSFRDCSKLDNLDTPTPLGNPDTEGYFVYPPDRRRPEEAVQDRECTYSTMARKHCCDGTFTSVISSTAYPLSYSAEAMKSSFLGRINCDTDSAVNTAYLSDSSTCSPQSNVPSSLDGTPLHGSSDVIFANESCPNSTERRRTGIALGVMEHVNDPRVLMQHHFQEMYAPQSNGITDSTWAVQCHKVSLAPGNMSENAYMLREINSQPSVRQSIGAYNSLPAEEEALPMSKSDPGQLKQKKTAAIEKAFQCQHPGCVKQFARIDELRRHQRTHSDVRQFVCDLCAKGFTRSDHLMTHRRTHTGERPYPCHFCDRRFARSDERNRHIKVHSRNKSRSEKKKNASSLRLGDKLLSPSVGKPVQPHSTEYVFL